MCGELNISHIGNTVVLNGWIQRKRNLGGLIFCDLRDKTGIVQIVFNQDVPQKLFEMADRLKSEYVVGIKGQVKERESKNQQLATGEIEIFVEDLVIYSESETPPIYIKDDDDVSENLRLKYRYLDLRKNRMQKNLIFRHNMMKITREFFDKEGFTEIETPMLIKPTPEGARDYLVPSRVNQGKFYALPQSPQMFKQILMVSGVDRYFQIVKCFRDEDLRADRQPEFTLIDLEMSFVDIDDVLEIQERYLKHLFKELMNIDIELPLPRLSYDEAMERYGTDKPDTRFGFELQSINEIVKDCGFKVFTGAIESGGDVRGININGYNDRFSRKDLDRLQEEIKVYGAKGLAWMRVEENEIKSSFSKIIDEETLNKIAKAFNAKANDLILIVAGPKKIVFDSLGFLRREIAQRLGLIDNTKYNFLWVLDFPLFEYDEEEGKYNSMHHPFTSPKDEDIDLLDTDPLMVRAKAYDIVLNGVELGGGSIRIHDKDLQKKIFSILGLSDEEIESKFGFLLEAFKYGTPPHGGLAYGLDRMAMILCNEKSIREVIAFPKNQAAMCMMSGAPSEASEELLEELKITTIKG
ncbi:MAG: aspartate--tRNA ligase [Clostridiales bacterium]|nr:aspartate--tRNA ligase [Clostridiales bacterium]